MIRIKRANSPLCFFVYLNDFKNVKMNLPELTFLIWVKTIFFADNKKEAKRGDDNIEK